MADEKSLLPTVAHHHDLQDTLTLGEVLARSGFFADARSASQAVVKVLAGRELGFPTIASMVGIHIIEGKPAIGAHLLASLIRKSPRYDFSVSQKEVRALIEELRKQGFKIKVGRHVRSKGNFVWIAPRDYPRAESAALRYWHDTYQE